MLIKSLTKMESNSAQQLHDAAEAFAKDKQSKMAYDLLLDLFGEDVPHGIVLNVSKNIKLFELFCEFASKKFLSLDDALKVFDGVDVLIYITELGLLGLFDPIKYERFSNRVYRAIGITVGKNLNISQFFAADKPNRFAFGCDNISDSKKKVLQGNFGEIYHISNLIVTSKTVNSKKQYDEMFSDVVNAIDRDGSVGIYPLTYRKNCYVVPIKGEVFCNLLTPPSLEDERLRDAAANKLNTVLWIKNNPPRNEEEVGDYYERYVSDYAYGINDMWFFGLVRNVTGYKTRIIDDKECWTHEDYFLQ